TSVATVSPLWMTRSATTRATASPRAIVTCGATGSRSAVWAAAGVANAKKDSRSRPPAPTHAPTRATTPMARPGCILGPACSSSEWMRSLSRGYRSRGAVRTGHAVLVRRYPQDSRAMRPDRRDDLADAIRKVRPPPEVAYPNIPARAESQLRRLHADLPRDGRAIQERDRHGPRSGELAHPHPDLAGAPEPSPWPAEPVLIERDDLGGGEDRDRVVAHRAEVVPGDEWRGEHRPEREVRPALAGGELAVRDLQHVGIVPVARARVRMECALATQDRHDARAVGLDVPAGAPAMTDRAGPGPRVRPAPFADRKDHRSPRRPPRERRLRVERARAHSIGVAPVDLDEVDPPVREEPSVAEFEAEARGEAHAGLRARVGVDAEAQPEGMHALGDVADAARELRGIGNEIALTVALGPHPAVVDHDVAIPRLAHPGPNQRLRRVDDEPLVDVALEGVPAVPAHRRRDREPVRKATEAHYGTTATRRARSDEATTRSAAALARPRRVSAMTLPPKPPPTRRAPSTSPPASTRATR